jgi:hypothetical protein
LFFNRGGKLEERAILAGVSRDDSGLLQGSMGLDVGDFDGSGQASLWVTNFQGQLPALYRNLGRENFHYASRVVGVAAIGQHLVSWGTGFLDVDNDGWEDLVIVNGHVLQHTIRGSTVKQRPVLLQNVESRGKRFFQDVSHQGGEFFSIPAAARGLAVGDLDNDGWPDCVVSHTNAPVALLRNEAGTALPNRWLGVKLVGRANRDVVGSTIVLEGNTRKQTRFAKGGGSYLSAGDPRFLFGLGAAEQVRSVSVKWSWGATQTWTGLEPNSYWELREDEDTPRRAGKRAQ